MGHDTLMGYSLLDHPTRALICAFTYLWTDYLHIWWEHTSALVITTCVSSLNLDGLSAHLVRTYYGLSQVTWDTTNFNIHAPSARACAVCARMLTACIRLSLDGVSKLGGNMQPVTWAI
jgi:hypothetical protein